MNGICEHGWAWTDDGPETSDEPVTIDCPDPAWCLAAAWEQDQENRREMAADIRREGR